jgi:transposase
VKATRIGIDLAKNFFHFVAMNERGKVLWRKALTRRRVLEFLTQLKPCSIGMEACATAHYWAREMQKLGHEVKLMHPTFVAAYRKSGKNDFNDAEAICEAMSRPMMRFVEVKSVAQQDMQSLHRTRSLMIKQHTQVAHQLRGLLAEYGIAVSRGIPRLRREAAELASEPERLTATMCKVVANNLEQLSLLERQVAELDREIARACRTDERSRRAAEVLGVGPLTATALVAKVGNARQFPNGRALSAYLGLVPRQHSTGGKTVLLNISKKGDRYLRTLLIHGARAALRVAPRHLDRHSQWALGLMRKRGPNVAAVALANKNARVLWKLLSSGEHFHPQPTADTDAYDSTIPNEMCAPTLQAEPDIDEQGSRKGSQQRKSRSLQRSALPVYPPRAPSPHTARTNISN